MRKYLRPIIVVFSAFLVFFGISSAGFATEMQNYIEDAKVGEWVLFEMQGGMMQQKQTVTGVTKDEVSVLTEIIINGNVMSKQEIKYPLKATVQSGAKDSDIKVKITNGNVKIKGKTISCIVTEVTTDQGISKSYLSKDIPVTGLIKTEMSGKTFMKLIDYGIK